MPDDDVEEAKAFLRDRGFDVRVEERDVHDEFRKHGIPFADTVSHPYWADLVRLDDPSIVFRNYGSGMSPERAILRARNRYSSEQR
jgi:hypothetical protein